MSVSRQPAASDPETLPDQTVQELNNRTEQLSNVSQTLRARSTATTTVPITSYITKPPSIRKVEAIDKQLVKMVAKGHHSLRIVDEPDFKILLDMVSHCPGCRLPSRKTLTTTLIPKTYIEVFERIQFQMSEAYAVCLATDGWTSSTNESYIAVTAHFINSTTTLCPALLGCINYNERHTSANLAAFLKQIAQDWRITDKIVCIVSDNAANILAAIRMGNWSLASLIL